MFRHRRRKSRELRGVFRELPGRFRELPELFRSALTRFRSHPREFRGAFLTLRPRRRVAAILPRDGICSGARGALGQS